MRERYELGGVYPWLVQRLKSDDNPNGLRNPYSPQSPVVGLRLDYMGSAEFEWGAIPQSFKRIRAREDLKDWKIVPIDHEGRVCYYVGPADQLGNATMWFQRELTEQGKTEMKDPSRLYESYTSDNHWDLERIGWWPVFEDRNAYYQKVDYAWAVFKTKEHADYWLRSLQEP